MLQSMVEVEEWCKVVLMHVLKIIREFNEKKVCGENLDTHILNEFGIEDQSQDKPGQLSYVDIAKNAKDPFQFLSSILLNLHTGDPSFRYQILTKGQKQSQYQQNRARNGKSVKKSKSMSKSQQVNDEAETEEILNGPTRTHLLGQIKPHFTWTKCHLGNPRRFDWTMRQGHQIKGCDELAWRTR
ncbi:hypothetical protein Tco_0324001 [Tanacetum coccineum]